MRTGEQLKIFISYSHEDEKYKVQLLNHLSSLKRREIIKEWHDRKLIPGEDWDGTIKQELIDSDIILLLISSDFLASNYCFDVEIKKAMERHDQGDAIVIPIILRPCDWKDSLFGKVQVLPKDAKPLAMWENIDEGYLDVIEGIKEGIKIEQKNFNKKNAKTEPAETLSFPREVVIGEFPRGYVVLEDIEFSENSSWSVKASYFDYANNWRHGTHYHESYHKRWDTTEGQDTQCRKLMIPKADWYIADSVIYLIMELRERKKDVTIEDVVKNYQNDDEYFNYYKKDEKIPMPVVPDKFIFLNKTGEIRDIIGELSIDSWKNYNLKTLHEDFESNRRKAFLLLFEKLDPNHPALIFVQEIIAEYKPGFDIDQLRTWGSRLSGALIDACKYIK